MWVKAVTVLLIACGSAAGDTGLDRRMGKELFERAWVQAPATTRASDGLGPLFNARSCAACHPGGGSAGFVETPEGWQSVGLLARFAAPGGAGDPYYGRQLQSASVTGLVPEGTVSLGKNGKPDLDLQGPPLSGDTGLGLRRAPTLAGRGLIDRISEAAIRAGADPKDRDGDGISGRVALVDGRVGRFGWKASHPDLKDQIAGAFAMDLGLSSARFPAASGDCTRAQTDCTSHFDGSDALGDGFELSETIIDLVASYVAGLGTQRQGDSGGAALFRATGCATCHKPAMQTDDGPVAVYSDLLLHDMGSGLADGIGVAGAAQSEWRTAPLIGMATSRSRLLHDGRAATVADAIDWHGGEAALSRDRYKRLDPQDRNMLDTFVEGL